MLCVGFSHGLNCQHLPVKISDLVPASAATYLKSQIEDLGALESTLNVVSPIYILILWIVLLFVSVVFAICCLRWPHMLEGRVRRGLLLAPGIMSFIVLSVLVIIFALVTYRLTKLLTWAQAHVGGGVIECWVSYGLTFLMIILNLVLICQENWQGKESL
jgi:hypothetical protein